MTLEGNTYSATIAWVEALVAASLKLQATAYEFYTLNGQLWVQVQGAQYEAHAWQVAVGGLMMPSHIDRRGVRRQMILGARAHVEVIDDPRRCSSCHATPDQPHTDVCARPNAKHKGPRWNRPEAGRLHPVLACAVAGIGLAVWGWTHPADHPNGATLIGLAGVTAAVGLLWILLATVRGYRRLEHGGRKRTAKVTKATKQSTSTAHFLDGI